MTSDRWAEINRIYDAAVEVEEKERAAFLEKACGEDAELRREVESLLAYDQQAQQLLDRPAFEVAAEKLAGEPPSLVGRQLGPYQILGVLGAGGMGEVFTARDTRLNRTVAIKVLPKHLSERVDLRQRFEREARAIASLDHPHICALYDIGHEGATDFLVMQYLDGETLSQRLRKGPLPTADVLRYSIEIAGALNTAHRKGVVHRDLKPGNIMLTETGAKLLDFGLAKRSVAAVYDRRGSESALTERRYSTESASLTEAGMILGTLEYMAPEQLEGKEADARTDLFALGVVIYEMATGRKAFQAESKASLIAAILTSHPPQITILCPLTPPELEEVVRKCLKKAPEERWQRTQDLLVELRRIAAETAVMPIPTIQQPALPSSPFEPKATLSLPLETEPRTARRMVRIRWKRWAIPSGLALLVILAYAAWSLQTTPPKITKFVQLTRSDGAKGPFFTDGTRLYFQMQTPTGQSGLFQLPVSGGTPVPIPTPFRGTALLDVSPDATEFLVLSIENPLDNSEDYPLWILPVLGGSPRRLGEIQAHDAAWSPDGKEIAYASGKDLYLVKTDGTELQKLVTLPDRFFYPRWAPDGQRLSFTVAAPGNVHLWEVNRAGKNLHPMLPGWPQSQIGSWTADGRYFLFSSDFNLWARREKPGSKPVQLTFPPSKVWHALPSKDGKKIFISAIPEFRHQLLLYNPISRQKSLFLMGVSATELSFSWDGKWVAYQNSLDGSLWRSRVDGSDKLQLTFPPISAGMPRWSPDGQQITFFNERNKDQAGSAYVVSAQGGSPRPLIPDQQDQNDAVWFPDGKAMIFGRPWPYLSEVENPALQATTSIYHLDINERQVSKLPGSEGLFAPRLSRDGRFLAASRHYGRPDQTLMLFDFKNRQWEELAAVQAHFREWSSDSRYFYFDSSAGKVPGIFRVRISDHEVEQVCNLEEFQASGALRGGPWFGLTPDDSILVARDLATQEIFALDWEAP